jgi:hypothetical protein
MQIARSVRGVVVRGFYLHGKPYAEGEIVDVTPGEFALLSSCRQIERAPKETAPDLSAAQAPKRKTRSEA